MGRSVDANIVGVAAELDSSGGLVVAAIKQLHRTVPGIGDIKRIVGGFVADSLWLLQSVNPVDQFEIREIDNSNGIVA